MLQVVALPVLLTFVLGGTTYVAFYLVGGSVAVLGPAMVWEAWWLIYPLVAVFAAVGGFVLARVAGARLSLPALAGVFLAGWLGEYVVLASGLLANELNLQNALYYWTLATAGPLQPAAALVGGWLARSRQRIGAPSRDSRARSNSETL